MDIYEEAVDQYAEQYAPSDDTDWFDPPDPVDAGMSTPLFSKNDYQILLREETVTIEDIHECFDRIYDNTLAFIAAEEQELLGDRYEFIDPEFDYTIQFADNDGYITYNWSDRKIKIDNSWRWRVVPRDQTVRYGGLRYNIRHELVHNLQHNERPSLHAVVRRISRAHTDREEQYHDIRQAPMEAITTFEQWIDQDDTKVQRRTPPLDEPWELPSYFHDKKFLAEAGTDQTHFSDGYELGHTAANTRLAALKASHDEDVALRKTRKHLLYDLGNPLEVKSSILDSIDMLDIPNYPYHLASDDADIRWSLHDPDIHSNEWVESRCESHISRMKDAETEEDALQAYTKARAFHDAHEYSQYTSSNRIDDLWEQAQETRKNWANA